MTSVPISDQYTNDIDKNKQIFELNDIMSQMDLINILGGKVWQ